MHIAFALLALAAAQPAPNTEAYKAPRLPGHLRLFSSQRPLLQPGLGVGRCFIRMPEMPIRPDVEYFLRELRVKDHFPPMPNAYLPAPPCVP